MGNTHRLCLLFGALVTSVSAFQSPFKRIVHPSSSAKDAVKRAEGDTPTTLDLLTAHDLIYIANITVQGIDYPVQLDSGSSDLWLKGDSSPLPNTQTTDIPANLTFGIGWVSGNVGYASAEFADISVDKQAFLDVSEANNPALSYGAKGLMGLGFTSLSTIDHFVNNTGSSEGRSFLYNLFEQNKDEPNFISFVLMRNSEIDGEMDGTFTLGEYAEGYEEIQSSQKLSTFPEIAPTRWNVLMDAAIIGEEIFYPSTAINGAPINKAVTLLDSGTSYSYVSEEFAEAIYGSVEGAAYDPALGQWVVPCDAEIDMAIQFSGQIIPVHPLDVAPKSLTNGSQCVGSFVPEAFSVGEGAFDVILGDNFLRAVYSVYDFGDFDSNGKPGNPFVQLLSLVNPDQASQEFAAARGSTAKTGIVYNAADSSVSPIIMTGGLSSALNNLETMLPAVLGVVALNAIVMIIILVVGLWWLCCRKKRNGKAIPREPIARMASARNSYIAGNEPDHTYEPVSMAITDDITLASPTAPFHSKMSKGFDRPMSLATLPSQKPGQRGSEDAALLTPTTPSFRPMSVGFPVAHSPDSFHSPPPPTLQVQPSGRQSPEDMPFIPPSTTGTLQKPRSSSDVKTSSPLAGPSRQPSFPPPTAGAEDDIFAGQPSSPRTPPDVPLRSGLRPGVALSDRPMSAALPSSHSTDFAPPRPAFRGAGSSSSGDRPMSYA